ncbi:class I SAM-dependent methyltransferase [Celeribacter sp. ULVN23_4]
MSSEPNLHVSPREYGAGRLLATLEGPLRFALLDWALGHGIFDLCAEGASADEIASARGYDPEQCRIILRALVAAGFLEGDAHRFHVPADIRPYVLADSDQSMIVTLRAMADLRHDGLKDIDDYLRPKRPQPQRPLFDDRHWDATYGSLQQFHKAVACDVMLKTLTGLEGFDEARRFLDIGPGSATLARRLLARRPDLDITLFDLSPMAQRMRREAADLPVEIIAGNYNAALPEGKFDIIWCSMTLYFHQNGLPDLVDKLADRLAPGGILVSLHEALRQDRTAPSEHVIGRLFPALRQGDVSFSDDDIPAAMRHAGLQIVRSEPLFTAFGEMQLDVARRPL